MKYNFDIPVDHLLGGPILVDYFAKKQAFAWAKNYLK